MRIATIVAASSLLSLGCDFLTPQSEPPGGSTDGSETGDLSATATTLPPGADTGAAGSSEDTIGATSINPPPTAESSSGDPPIDETTGEDPRLDLPPEPPTPATEVPCDWLLPPVGLGPTPLWCNQLIPEDFDEAGARRVAVGAEGEIYVTGHASVGFISQDSRAAILSRYMPEGARVWTQTFEHGSLGWDWAHGVVVVPGGDVVVAGVAAHGPIEEHGWVSRITPDGVPLWDLDLPEFGYTRRMAAHVDGTFVISGGEPYWGFEEPPAHITKHASDGTQEWLYAPSGTLMNSENTGRSAAIDAAGNVYVSGSLSDRSRFVAKLVPDGTVAWEQVWAPIDPYDWNYAEDLVVSPAGDVFTSGRVEDQAWIARLTTDGVEVWSDFVTVPDQTGGFGPIARLPDGDLVVAGDLMDAQYDYTLWLRRYTQGGAVVWDYFLPDPTVIGITMDDLEATPDGDVVLVGQYYDYDVGFHYVARLQP